MTAIPYLLEGTGPILMLDRSQDLAEPDVLYSFALDELLCRVTGRGGPAICHIWRHPRAFVMGVRDSRLPKASEAEVLLQTLGYDTATRHSGGAAVPLDPGVVNLSLILPLGDHPNHQNFHQDFEMMVLLIREALKDSGYTVDTGEIAGAFCPGAYDLSIHGRKFCGIAQRRQSKSFIIQAFIIAEGSGSERARLVRSFYDQAAGQADPADYPLVQPDSTASLEELADLGPNAVSVFTEAVKKVIRNWQLAADPAALTAAAAKLVLPSPEEIRTMAHSLRQRYMRE
ncbi:lipoate--protein ligase family protein [Paenibacillus dakarensis]|uniref:lipoate--protein ligase family protein n=1 Tax=Paenibacillus dakarensis TaxID=1527293 RepID=UPI0006D52FA6|nr:ligase [Paenibacillus dakarensis]